MINTTIPGVPGIWFLIMVTYDRYEFIAHPDSETAMTLASLLPDRVLRLDHNALHRNWAPTALATTQEELPL
jgi:hypothetical protein